MKILTVSTLLGIPLVIDGLQYLATNHYLNEIKCNQSVEASRVEAKRLIEQDKTIVDYVLFGGINLSARHYLSK